MAESKIKSEYSVSEYDKATLYRFGRLRQIKIKSNATRFFLTLSATDSPSTAVFAAGKVYNGSTYVDASITIFADGGCVIQDLWGHEIPGMQVAFLTPNVITYFV